MLLLSSYKLNHLSPDLDMQTLAEYSTTNYNLLFVFSDIVEKDPDSECKRLAAQTLVLMQSSVKKV